MTPSLFSIKEAILLINWSYSDATDTDIQDGYYKAIIQDCTLTNTRKGNEMLVLKFKVEGSSYTPTKFQLTEPIGNYSAAAIKRDIANIAKCFNVPEGSTDPDDFLNRKGFIKISHKPRKDNPEQIDLVISFPAPDKGQAAYLKHAQELAAQKFAQQNADLDTWNPDHPLF